MGKVGKYCLVFFSLIAAYLAFMVIASLLPEETVHRNVKRSVADIQREGNYGFVLMQYSDYQVDNFTDALMMATAWEIKSDSLRTALFENRHPNVGMDMSIGLQTVVDEVPYSTRPYPRYWHGNTFLMRLLLCFGNYSNIRFSLYVISSLVFVFACCLLYPRMGLPFTLLFFAAFVLMKIFVTQLSLQMVMCVLIAVIFSAFVCVKAESWHSLLLGFFITGSLTAFFDLFTTPLLTVGMPMVVFLIMNRKIQEKESLLKGYGKLASLSGLWLLGYAGTWITKWTLSTVFTDTNIFADGFHQVLRRSGARDDFSRMDAVFRNFDMFPWATFLTICLILIVLVIFFFNKKNIKTALLAFSLILVPYIWFWIVSNHSYIHWWLAYRIQMIAIASAFTGLAVLVDWDKIVLKRKSVV